MKSIFKILSAALCFSVAFVMTSCNDDNDSDYDYHEVALKFEGVSASNGLLFQRIVKMPGAGGTFTVETDGTYADKGYLMAMALDGKVENVPAAFKGGAPYQEGVNVFSGDWGAISYIHGRSPFKYKVEISANHTGKDRKIDIQFGEDFIYTIVTVNQESEQINPDPEPKPTN